MFSVRTGAGSRSSWKIPAKLGVKRPLVEYDAPPPGYCQSPVTPGSA